MLPEMDKPLAIQLWAAKQLRQNKILKVAKITRRILTLPPPPPLVERYLFPVLGAAHTAFCEWYGGATRLARDLIKGGVIGYVRKTVPYVAKTVREVRTMHTFAKTFFTSFKCIILVVDVSKQFAQRKKKKATRKAKAKAVVASAVRRYLAEQTKARDPKADGEGPGR